MASTFLGHSRDGAHARPETPRAVRIFLLRVLAFAVIWGGLFFRREWLHGQWQGYGLWLGAWTIVVLFGLLFPAPFRPVRRAVTRLGAGIGHALSWIALAAIYWLALAPIGILARLAGKRFLAKGGDAKSETYWIERQPMPEDKSAWEKQF